MNTLAIANLKDFAQKCTLQNLASCCVIAGIFLIMLSVSIMDKLFAIASILVILQPSWRENALAYLKQPIVSSALALIVLFSLGLLYSQGYWHDAFHFWNKYLKVIYPLFFLPLFIDATWRRYAISALIIGVVIAEIFTYLRYFEFISLGLSHTYHWFVHDIDGSFIVAFVCYVLLNLIADDKKNRWWYILAFIFIGFDLFFLNQERTGYLVFTFLAGLFLLQRLGRKGFLMGLLIIPLTIGGLYFSSNTFHHRVNLIFSDMAGYAKGDATTSIGLRLAFAEYSVKIIKNSPVLGSGTGSFPKLYQQLQGPKLDGGTWPGHPHNEYISILLQIGVVGFLFFLLWIFFHIRESFHLPLFEKRLAQGLILAFLLLSLCNSSLSLSPGSNLYVVLLAVLIAAKFSGKAQSLDKNSPHWHSSHGIIQQKIFRNS